VANKGSTKRRHVPQRMCVVCRQRYDKRRLTRIVNTKVDGVLVDETGKQNGRGAYLCDQLICWEKVIGDPRVLENALKTELTPQEREMISQNRPTINQVME
jgi:uncharacterized protein